MDRSSSLPTPQATAASERVVGGPLDGRGGQVDEARQRGGWRFVAREELEGERPAGIKRAGNYAGRHRVGRGRQGEDFVCGDRGVQRRPRRDGHQLRVHPELVEELGDGAVKGGTVAVPRNSDPLTVQLLDGNRTTAA